MSNITDIYWEFNGMSLHTGAWAADTFGGGRYMPADKRGEDDLIPGQTGRRATKKARESRVVPLSMWLAPKTQDGDYDSTMSREQRLHLNWEEFWAGVDTDGQAPFVKRWWGGVDGSTVMEATAMAEVLDFPDDTVSPGLVDRFIVEFNLADPWFYGATESESEGTFTVLGNESTRHVVFDLTVTGPARVEMSDGNYFTYSGGAGNLIVDSRTGLATLNGVPVNGMMRKSSDFWTYAEFKPGTFTVDFVSGISGGSIDYEPAYR